MADRVSVTIKIGGTVKPPHRDQFLKLIESYALTTFEDDPFDPAALPLEGPLELAGTEIAWGRLDNLEAFCIEHGLAFARWCDSCPGAWEAERLVFDGTGEPRSYTATTNDVLVITAPEVRSLGSMAAIEAWLTSGEPKLPGLTLRPPQGERA
jgi:hypothetical protein